MEALTFDTPKKPSLLKVLEILEKRKQLNDEDLRELRIQQKGYEGEKHFATLIQKHLPSHALVIYSVLLKVNHHFFQIDCMIITRGGIQLIDLKNYEGDYTYDGSDFLRLPSEKKISNPLHQLERCETLLHDFLAQFKVSRKIDAHIIFINPQLMLYQAPLHPKIIYSPQVERYLHNISPASLHPGPAERKLAHTFQQHHIHHNPFEYIPKYHFRELRKGILCHRCGAPMEIVSRVKLCCNHCGAIESLTSAVMRSVLDFHCLFPDIKIGTKVIHDWMDGMLTRKRIIKILNRYMKKIGSTRGVHYEFYGRI